MSVSSLQIDLTYTLVGLIHISDIDCYHLFEVSFVGSVTCNMFEDSFITKYTLHSRGLTVRNA